jgi:hypothetical protein
MPDDARSDLEQALRELRAVVAETHLPLPLPSAEHADGVAAGVRAQLDDHLLPRLAHPDAPLLAAVGGPTGAGKSTLVNSLIRAPASAAGVLRPTTRAPVLVCHPTDATWFRSATLLGGFARTSSPTDDPTRLHLVTAPALGAGCAFLDTPDINSVVGRSREVSHQLLAAADLWLFMVTAARYADAVPWQLLHTGRERGTVVALVLGRVPDHATAEVVDHIREMLAAHELADTPLFVVPETRVDDYGLLPETAVEPLRDWFNALAADAAARAALVRQTLDGAIAALSPSVEVLACAVEEQVAAAEVLAEHAGMAYGAARSAAERGVRDGALLRGPVMARWQEFVATGEWLRTPLATAGRLRDRLAAAVTRSSGAGRALTAAVESRVLALVRAVTVDAAEQTYQAWRSNVGAEPLLAGSAGADLSAPRPAPDGGDGGADPVATMVAHWRDGTLDLVRSEMTTDGGRLAHAPEATAAMVLMAVAAPPVPPAGAEEDRQVLAAVLEDEIVRKLATKAREDLLDRISVHLDGEAARYLDLLAESSLDTSVARRLRERAAALERVRAAAFSSADSGDPAAAGEPATAGDSAAGDSAAGDSAAGESAAGDSAAEQTRADAEEEAQ